MQAFTKFLPSTIKQVFKQTLLVKFSLFIVLFSLSQSIKAQISNLETSVVTGINFSEINGDGEVGYNKIGLAAGLQLKYTINPTLDISGGVLYSQRGSTERKAHKTHNGETFDISLNYLEAPVLLHYKSKDNFSLSAGVVFARLISGKHEMLGDEHKVHELYDFSNSQWDQSFNINFCYQFKPEFQLTFGWTKSLKAFYQTDDNDNRGFFHNILQLRALVTPSKIGDKKCTAGAGCGVKF